MLWAAACLAFFGFFRLGELFGNATSPLAVLASDVAVDSHTSPTVLKVHLHRGKTDPFGLRVSLYLGQTGSELCPVCSMLKFLAIRKPNNDVLFTREDGTPKARDYFVGRVREALYAARLDPSKYSGHSFRVGAATSAARAGLVIKMLGRWRSEAYQLYTRMPAESLAAISKKLI